MARATARWKDGREIEYYLEDRLKNNLDEKVIPDLQKRDIKEVEPIIGECWVDDKGELFLNMDDLRDFRKDLTICRKLCELGIDF